MRYFRLLFITVFLLVVSVFAIQGRLEKAEASDTMEAYESFHAQYLEGEHWHRPRAKTVDNQEIKNRRSELKTMLLQWEEEAPNDVKKEIITLRTSKDAVARFYAAFRLGKMGERAKGAIRVLIETLRDDTPLSMRRGDLLLSSTSPGQEAKGALVNIGFLAVEPLIYVLKDNERLIYRRAVEALGQIKDRREAPGAIDPAWGDSKAAKEVVPGLIAALRDKDGEVHRSTAAALGAIDPNWRDNKAAGEMVPVFISALKNNDGGIRRGAARALGEIKDPCAVEPLIIRALKDEDVGVRREAVAALGAIEPEWRDSKAAKGAVPGLIIELKDMNKVSRRRAAEVLGRIKDRRAVKPLIEALKDDDWQVRKNAAEALKWMNDPHAVEPLIAALKDIDRDIRFQAASALSSMEDSRAVEPLIAVLQDEDPRIRWIAAVSLGRIKDRRAVKPLIDALKDEDYQVCGKAADSLKAITGMNFGTDYKGWNSWWEGRE
ncbi:MAG: HEAT repeat domain-containing protein [Candidatus Omnitrophica bacterium]|nr:HEAT repeat domain-containing protein [Candidatus Omnitrophota bacterium]